MENVGCSRFVCYACHRYDPVLAGGGKGKESCCEAGQSDDFSGTEEKAEINEKTGWRQDHLEEHE